MKRVIVAAAVLTSSGVAAAGGYAGLGIGPEVAISENTNGLSSGGRSARLLGGYSFGKFAAEAALTGQGITAYGADYDAKQLSLAGKFNVPLGSDFEAFGRVGVQKTWVTMPSSTYAMSGSGLLIGGGFEYRVKLSFASGSVFVDYTIGKATLSGEGENAFREDADYTTRQWMLGFTVGI